MVILNLSTNINKRDENFFKILFETYNKKVYKIAYYILKNEQDAKDTVQEAFINAYRKIDTLKEHDKFGSWISTIALNIARDKYKARKNEVLTDEYENIITFGDFTEELQEDIVIRKELNLELLEQINQLKYHYREVIFLYYYLELSYEEISQCLEVSLGTVKSRLSRAKLILKKKILASEKEKSII
ncbi:RNA polymerase sigma factor [Alkaliphilus peptidifermentans]|uniref:RNA polymerase sigma factor n=1 Tax=Alkaliphilus peptidifermentans TaxID=426129 RepID=UPI002FE53407